MMKVKTLSSSVSYSMVVSKESYNNVFFSLKSAAKNKISLRCFFTHHQQSREEFLNFFVLPSLLFLRSARRMGTNTPEFGFGQDDEDDDDDDVWANVDAR